MLSRELLIVGRDCTVCRVNGTVITNSLCFVFFLSLVHQLKAGSVYYYLHPTHPHPHPLTASFVVVDIIGIVNVCGVFLLRVLFVYRHMKL